MDTKEDLDLNSSPPFMFEIAIWLMDNDFLLGHTGCKSKNWGIVPSHTGHKFKIIGIVSSRN